jgi:transcriptional regulator with XRE-family HTH domain
MEMSAIQQVPVAQTLSFRALLIIILQKIKISNQDLRKKGVSPTIMEEFLKGESRGLTTGVVDNLEKNLPLSAYGKDRFRETYQTNSIALTNQEIERMFASGRNSGNNYAPRDERQLSNQEKLRAAKSSREFMIELREQLELAKEEMACIIGMSFENLKMIEDGKSVVMKKSVEKVIDEFDIHPRVAAVFRNLAECDREDKKKTRTYVQKPRPAEQRPQRFYQEKSLAFKKPGSDMPDFLKDVSKEKLTVFAGQIEGQKGGRIVDVEKKKEEPQEKAMPPDEKAIIAGELQLSPARARFARLVNDLRIFKVGSYELPGLTGIAKEQLVSISMGSILPTEEEANAISACVVAEDARTDFLETFRGAQEECKNLFGNLLKRYRTQRKLSGDAIEKAIGIPFWKLSALERQPNSYFNERPELAEKFIEFFELSKIQAEELRFATSLKAERKNSRGPKGIRNKVSSVSKTFIDIASIVPREAEAPEEQTLRSPEEEIFEEPIEAAIETKDESEAEQLPARVSESIRDTHLPDANATLKKTIGEMIRWARESLQWKQIALVGQSGATITEIDNIEKGVNLPEIRLLSRIVEVLQFTPREKYLLAMIYGGCMPDPIVVELKGNGAEFIMELFQIFGKGAFADNEI